MAGKAFFRLIHVLRKTFFQDIVHWQRRHPDHYIFSHSLFQDQEYLDFARRDLTATSERVYDTNEELKRVVPILAREMEVSSRRVDQSLSQIHSAVTQLSMDLASTRSEVQQSTSISATMHQALSRPTTVLIPPLLSSTTPLVNIAPTLSRDEVTLTPPEVSAQVMPAAPCPPFSMSRRIRTATDLWTEYASGLGGKPAVRSMYESGSDLWRRNDSERKFYDRRRPIWQSIKKVAETRHITPEEAAAQVEAFRRSQGSLTLEKLSIKLRNMSESELNML